MTPERIGRYRIVDQIGRGGFATVYLGEDQGLDDLVAIKVLSADLAADRTAVTRFVAEAHLMRNQRAPGVVTVHDVGEFDDRPFFVMEYCPRGTLSERLERLARPLTLDEAQGLADALGTAVGDLHQASPPVVHRDLKPANLLIRHRPNRKGSTVGQLLAADEGLIVGDFGLAKVTDVSDTKFTLVAYSRGFAPPEQLRGDATIGPTADVYSASAVLVAALSGMDPVQVFSDGDRAFDDRGMAAAGPLQPELARGLSYGRDLRHPTIVDWASALADRSVEYTHSVPPPAVNHVRDVLNHPVAPLRSTAPPTPTGSPADGPFAAPQGPRYAAPAHSPNPVADSAPVPGLSPDQPGARTGRRSTVLILGLAAMALLVLLAGSVLVATRTTGPGVTGPERSLLGNEVAFFVTDAGVTVEEWRIGDERFPQQILQYAPTEAGDLVIEVVTDDGTRELTLEVDEPESQLFIDGLPLMAIEDTTTLSARGADGLVVTAEDADLTWTVAGRSYVQPTLELQPAEPGVITVAVVADDGRRTERTFTIPPAGG